MEGQSHKHFYHMSENEIVIALGLLEERNKIIESCGDPGKEHSFDAIGAKVGHSGEAIRMLSMKDMSHDAVANRLNAKLHSRNLLTE